MALTNIRDGPVGEQRNNFLPCAKGCLRGKSGLPGTRTLSDMIWRWCTTAGRGCTYGRRAGHPGWDSRWLDCRQRRWSANKQWPGWMWPIEPHRCW